jgi:hypothetical protein
MNAERKLSPQFSIYVAIPIVLAALFGLWWLYMGAIWLQGALPPFWEQNKYTIIIIGTILLLGSTSHKWVPMLWGAHRARRLHEQEMLDRMAHRKLIEAAAVKMGEGFNTKYSNSKTGDLIEMLNPYVQAKASRQITEVGEEQEVKQIEAPKNPLPTYVRYEDIASQIPQDHALVGIDGDGVITRERAVKALIWIVGGSGSGKTNTASLRIEEDYKWGHHFLVIDPHWFKGDSLWNAIKGYQDRFIVPIQGAERPFAYETEDIIVWLDFFLKEFERRKKGGSWQYPITLVIDEIGSLVTDKTEDLREIEMREKIKKATRIAGQESRDFDMTCMCMSQDAAGLAWLRKRAVMVIAHQLLMMSERLLACNDNAELARSMDTWPIGRTAVYGIGFKEGQRTVQQPDFKPRVVESTLVETEKFYQAVTEKLPEQKATHYYSPTSQTVASKSSDFSFERGAQPTKRIQTGELLGEITQLEKRLPDTGVEELSPSEDGKFKFTPEEQRLVIELYKAHGNIDKVLTQLKRGARWHKDASRIVREAGLMKD